MYPASRLAASIFAYPGRARPVRSRIKPLLARLQCEFNLSAAEVDLQDAWQSAVVQCALVSNDAVHVNRSLQHVVRWIETEWLDLEVEDDRIELL